MVNPLMVFFALPIFVLEVCLLYINYLARVKYKQYFREQNWIWRFFDRSNNVPLSLLLHFGIVFIFTLAAMSIEITFPLGTLFGFLYANLYFDFKTYSKFKRCAKRKCLFMEEKVDRCRQCEVNKQ